MLLLKSTLGTRAAPLAPCWQGTWPPRLPRRGEAEGEHFHLRLPSPEGSHSQTQAALRPGAPSLLCGCTGVPRAFTGA